MNQVKTIKNELENVHKELNHLLMYESDDVKGNGYLWVRYDKLKKLDTLICDRIEVLTGEDSRGKK